MKIRCNNGDYKVEVSIKVKSLRGCLIMSEIRAIRIGMGNAVIHGMEGLPYACNSVAGGDIKVVK